ncbi:hypothetical protein [Streptomyces bullii]|uniref:Uncharacterized protein n=1 Tax=Streptomyces bullii TaxID=349910 RepID=A0ABW0UMV8_9ACTN
MESPARPRVWYFFSDDVPEGQVILPIKCEHGLAFAIRPGEMTPAMLEGLNQTAKFVLDIGLAHISQTVVPRDGERKE